MGFFTGMPSHMHDKHVLSLERFLLPRTAFPSADEALFIDMDVIRIYMFN